MIAKLCKCLFGFQSSESEAGFTLTEVLVATGLTSILMATVIGHVMMIRQGYFDDIVRTRINSNLRSAMDILSMNIRQAGENLATSFPAVELANGGVGSSDTLTLRRAIVGEALTICNDATAGDTTLNVSSAAVASTDCTASNVANVYSVFDTYRQSDADGVVRAFLFDTINGTSEFVDFTAGGESLGEYYLTVSELENDFPAETSFVFLIEEYRFERDSLEDTLVLTVDGISAEPKTVAFSVSDFQVDLELADGSVAQALDVSSAASWRDILQVDVTLSGEETRRDRTLTSSIEAQYFPRNVLSY